MDCRHSGQIDELAHFSQVVPVRAGQRTGGRFPMAKPDLLGTDESAPWMSPGLPCTLRGLTGAKLLLEIASLDTVGLRLIVKPVFHLQRHHAGIGEMSSTKSVAGVQQVTVIEQIRRTYAEGEVFAE